MSLGVLQNLFEQLNERHGEGSATAETAAVSPGVSAKPAPALGCTSATAETAHSDVSGNQVAAQAANDTDPDLSDWRVTLPPGIKPGTVALFRSASLALDASIKAAGEAAPDPDRDCWPHSSAMNTGEIDRMVSRVELFVARGLNLIDATALADKLVIRDRDGDERGLCLECRHLSGRRCGAWRQAGLTGPAVSRDLVNVLQRCAGFENNQRESTRKGDTQ
jgi:hypothetical protein